MLPQVALRLERARVVHDSIDLLAPAVVLLETWRILVRHLGARGDRSAHHLAHVAKARLDELAVLGQRQPLHDLLQVRVDFVPVEPDRALVLRVVDALVGRT